MEEVIMNQPFCSPVQALRSVLDLSLIHISEPTRRS